MGKLVHFIDGNTGCWSRVDLESGEPIWISIAQTGVLVKKSKTGMFGAKLYTGSDGPKVVDTVIALSAEIAEYTTPPDMTNPLLRVFTQVALDSSSVEQFCARIERAGRSS